MGSIVNNKKTKQTDHLLNVQSNERQIDAAKKT